MEIDRVEFETFIAAAVSGMFDALQFAQNGDAQALQSVFNEIALHFATNYIESDAPEEWASELANSADFASLTSGAADLTDTDLRNWLSTALNFDDNLRELVLEGSAEQASQDDEIDVSEATDGLPTDDGAGAISKVDATSAEGSQGNVSIDDGEKSQDDPSACDNVTDDKSQVTTEEHDKAVPPKTFTYGEVLAAIKSQMGEQHQAVMEAHNGIVDRLEKLERNFTITMPDKAAGSTAQKSQPKGKRRKVVKHELKFGQHFNDSRPDVVDEDAVKQMLSYAGMNTK